jgi:PEP-CTERM motif
MEICDATSPEQNARQGAQRCEGRGVRPDGIVAYSVDGGSLGSSGFARLVIPADNRGGRYVSNLASIQVHTVPEPSTMALTTLALLALLSHGRTRAGVRRVPTSRRIDRGS